MALDFNNMDIATGVQFLQYVGGQNGLDPRVIEQQIRDFIASKPLEERTAFAQYTGAPLPQEPVVPGLSPLQERGFAQGESSAQLAFDQAMAQLGLSRANTTENYGVARRDLGRQYDRAKTDLTKNYKRNFGDLVRQIAQDRSRLPEGYAQRGILDSGIAKRGIGEFVSEAARQKGRLTGDYNRNRQRLGQDRLSAFQSLLRNYNQQQGQYDLSQNQLNTTLNTSLRDIGLNRDAARQQAISTL